MRINNITDNQLYNNVLPKNKIVDDLISYIKNSNNTSILFNQNVYKEHRLDYDLMVLPALSVYFGNSSKTNSRLVKSSLSIELALPISLQRDVLYNSLMNAFDILDITLQNYDFINYDFVSNR